MTKQHLFKLWDNMYASNIMLAVGGDRLQAAQKFCKWMKFEKPEPASLEIEKMFAFTYYLEDKSDYLVYIPKKPKTPDDHAAIAHECMHVAIFLLNARGIKLMNDPPHNDNEPFLYYLAWLVGTVYGCLEKI